MATAAEPIEQVKERIDLIATTKAREEVEAGAKLIDVREPHEWEISRIEGAQLIPLRELPGRLAELAGHGEIVTLCHHGPRSLKAREILKRAGFANVRSLAGGIDAWAREVDPEVPRY